MKSTNFNKIVSLKVLIFIVYIYMLIFSSILSNEIPIIGYFDELLAVIGAISIIIELSARKRTKKFITYDKKLFMSLLFLSLLGVISNYFSKLQVNTFPIIVDMFEIWKVFLAFYAIRLLFTHNELVQIRLIISKTAKIVVIITFFFGVINCFKNIGMDYELRYGIKSYMFIFDNPGTLAVMLVFFLTFIKSTNKKNSNIYILMILLLLLLTTRAVAIASVGLYFYLDKILGRKIAKKFKVRYLISIIIFSVLLTVNQIKAYFIINNTTPRYLLVKYGIVTAEKYFPIGSGFATYASDMAYKYYSNLYMEYGLYKQYGMSPMQGYFLHDAFWPMLLGQFGLVGIFIYIHILVQLFKKIGHRNITDACRIKMIYFLLIYILINSLVASTLVSTDGTLLMIGIAILLE